MPVGVHAGLLHRLVPSTANVNDHADKIFSNYSPIHGINAAKALLPPEFWLQANQMRHYGLHLKMLCCSRCWLLSGLVASSRTKKLKNHRTNMQMLLVIDILS